jgi:hypothetical protein
VRPEPAPIPAPIARRFRTREEFLTWITQN